MLFKKIFLFAFLICFCFPVLAQVTQQENSAEQQEVTEAAEPAEYNSDVIFVINSFNYNVKGRTLPFMLNTKTELKIGEKIKGYDKLTVFIEDKKQLLINERVLKDNARIEYTLGEPTEDGKIPVDLQIYTEDTWNFIALPYPKYSSSSGLSITLKARDYNFLGTMNPLSIDLGYRSYKDSIDNKQKSYYTLMLDTGIPFMLFGLKWQVDFENDFYYRPGRTKEYNYKNSTGISVDIPIGPTTLTPSFHEQFIVNDELSITERLSIFKETGIPIQFTPEFQEGLYMSSLPKISWKIPTPLEVGNYGFLTYTPSIFAIINHEIGSYDLISNRDGATFAFAHTLGFGKINWKGNFKQGFSVNVSNTFARFYSFYNDDWDPVSSSVTLSTTGHFVFKDFLIFSRGLSVRALYRHYFNSYNPGAGDVIRGIIDDTIYADYIASLNIDVPVRVLKIRPSEWFPNNKFMSVFDFDMHMVPVFDIAIYKGYRSDDFNKTNPENEILTGMGLEFIVFPQRWRSLFFRASFAFDVSDISKGFPREIFLGMELFF